PLRRRSAGGDRGRRDGGDPARWQQARPGGRRGGGRGGARDGFHRRPPLPALMDVADAIERVLLGESLRAIAAAHREELIVDLGLDPAEVAPDQFRGDTRRFMNRLCRTLAERHEADWRVAAALAEWVQRVDEYDAFDALLSHFPALEGRELIVPRGRPLFPGPLTAHWGGGEGRRRRRARSPARSPRTGC